MHCSPECCRKRPVGLFLECHRKKKRKVQRNTGFSFWSEALLFASILPEFCSPGPGAWGRVGNWRCTESLGCSALYASWEVGFSLGRTGVNRQVNSQQWKTGNRMEVTVSLLNSSVPSEPTGRPGWLFSGGSAIFMPRKCSRRKQYCS